MPEKAEPAKRDTGAAEDSPLSLVAQAERESDAMLRACRAECEETRQAAIREAAAVLETERTLLEEAEKALMSGLEAEHEGRRRAFLESAASELEALRRRVEARLPEAVRTVIEVVLGSDST